MSLGGEISVARKEVRAAQPFLPLHMASQAARGGMRARHGPPAVPGDNERTPPDALIAYVCASKSISWPWRGITQHARLAQQHRACNLRLL